MSIVPAFEIGVWNAWIFILCSLIPMFLSLLASKGREEGSKFDDEFSKAQKNAHNSLHIIYMLLLIYSIFLPLQLGTIWFYAGLTIYLLALIPYTIVFMNVATTPTNELVVKGIYRYSRHPMYLTSFLVFIGVGIASASWIYLLLSVVYIIMPLLFVDAEERHCLKFYGDSYREYINRTPKWIGIPKG